MDPYLELPGNDHDFAAHFRATLSEKLNEVLPDQLVARHNAWDDYVVYNNIKEEVKERWIEIRKAGSSGVLTVIEILTREYKTGEYFSGYVGRRGVWLSQPLHLIELDLFLAGRHHALRNDDAVHYSINTYSPTSWGTPTRLTWTIRDRSPRMAIPFGGESVNIDLADVLNTSYDRAGYSFSTDYRAALNLPLSDQDREWARTIALTAVEPTA
jgi:hypothetical protein